MRAIAGIFIMISLLFLIGAVGAVGIPDTVYISTDKPWIVANNVDQSTITIRVENTTTDPGVVPGATVTLLMNDTAYGTFDPNPVTTGPSGTATSTFRVRIKSGAALITVAGISNGSGIQNIDHDRAYYATFTHALNATVASLVPFNVSITDEHLNLVDNRRGNHIISLHTHGPSPDDGGFAEAGFAHDIASTLDASGRTSVTVRLAQRIGDNYILMDGYQSIPDQLEWITAEARGTPFSITQVVSPSGSPPTLPADNRSVFLITYTLLDQYGNPTNGQTIWVNTSVNGEEEQFPSNSVGQVVYPYGPRPTVGEIYITATALANSTVTTTPLMVKFGSTSAQIITLTADPSMMPSHDVPPSATYSTITATVTDASGNAVRGERVSFSIAGESYDGTYNVTAHPSLSSPSAITDDFGQAAVRFTSGNFTTYGNPGFSASATGHCNVIAAWNATQKSVPVTWKNYPFLSATTSVDPDTIDINETINVSIAFYGDGWAFTQPSDVVLVTDLSGSMDDYLNGGNTKLSSTQTALKRFVGLGNGQLSIALASYSNDPNEYSAEAMTLWNQQYANRNLRPFNPYGGFWDRCAERPSRWYSDARIDRDFSLSMTSLNSTIDSYHANGGTCIGCGLNAAKTEFDLHGDPTHPRAIIIMSDGIANLAPISTTSSTYMKAYLPSDYNSWTDTSELAKTAAINIATALKGQNIKIFTIAFGNRRDVDTDTLTRIASPGCDYLASDGTALSSVYADIFTKVNDPGVDVTMSTDFTHINATGITVPGADVYTYVPSTRVGWQNGSITSTDQTGDWADYTLDFTIGTIKLKEQWNATFQLRVNRSGLIDVFGNDSTVTFNGGTQTLYLPHQFITVKPKLGAVNITEKELVLRDLALTISPEDITVLLPVTWHTTYTGNGTLTEKVYYQEQSGNWVLFDTKTHVSDNTTSEYSDFAQLDVTKIPQGSYLIRVYATAPDAPDATITLDIPVVLGRGDRPFIRLE